MKKNISSRIAKWMSLAGAAAVAMPAGLHAEEHGNAEGLEPVLSSVSDLQLKGSFGAEFGASSSNRNRGLGPTQNYHTFNISHLRLGIEGDVHDDFQFDTVLSLLPSVAAGGTVINDLGGEGAGVNLYHATLTYSGLDFVDLSVGYEFPRFGMEAYAHDEDLITIMRSVLSTTLRPSQHTGVSAHGDWDIFDYRVGVYNSEADGSANQSGSYPNSYLFNLSGGVDLDEYVRAIHDDLSADLRADFIYNDEAGTTNTAELYKNAFALGTNIEFMDVNVAYEYIWARSTAPGPRPRVQGYILTPSYFITDDLQAVVRYERVRNTEGSTAGSTLLGHNAYAADVQGVPAAAAGNKYQALYLGSNYYMYEDRLKLMGGIELAELRDTEGANTQSRTHTLMTAVRMQF